MSLESKKYCYILKMQEDHDQKYTDTFPICPFCNYIDKNDGTMQFDDYVDVPMIW